MRDIAHKERGERSLKKKSEGGGGSTVEFSKNTNVTLAFVFLLCRG